MDLNQMFQCKPIMAGSVSCFETAFQFFCSRNDKTEISYSEKTYNDFFFLPEYSFKSNLYFCVPFFPCQSLNFFEWIISCYSKEII